MLEHIIQGMEPANLVKLMVYENRGSRATLYRDYNTRFECMREEAAGEMKKGILKRI